VININYLKTQISEDIWDTILPLRIARNLLLCSCWWAQPWPYEQGRRLLTE